jgi:hypothetical protein
MMIAFVLLFGLLAACSDLHADNEALKRCWEASPAEEAGQFRVKMEGIALSGVEGGVWSASARCPRTRARLVFSPSLSNDVIDNAVQVNLTKGVFMTGFSGELVVSFESQKDGVVNLVVVDVLSMKILSAEAVMAYLEEHGG